MLTTPAPPYTMAPTERSQGRASILPSVGIVWMLSSLGALAAMQIFGQQQNVELWAPTVSTARMPVRSMVLDRTRVAQGGLATSKPISHQVGLSTTASNNFNEWPHVEQASLGEDHHQVPHVENTWVAKLLSIPMLAGALLYLWRDKRGSTRMAIAPSSGYVDKGLDPNDKSRHAKAERYRFMRRTVFGYNDWREARAPARLFANLLTMPRSMVVLAVLREVIIISLMAVGACILQIYGIPWLTLPSSTFALSAPSLSLLLVFRTNASYGRWDDARKILATSLNRCRDTFRQAITWFPKDFTGTVLKERMLRYVQAWPYALKGHLRGGPGGCENDDDLLEDLIEILSPEELDLLMKSPHRPLHILQTLTEIAREAGLPTAPQLTLDRNLNDLSDVVGGCERILRTPIPLSYSRMTGRFLALWLIGLPFALSWDIVRMGFSVWATVPCTAGIAFLLLGIEELATQLEEPFSILPMEAYADTCKNNIDGMGVWLGVKHPDAIGA